MRIRKEEIVAGYSALQVRGFLRRFERGFFMRSAAERFMQLKSCQAIKFIGDMITLELIEPTAPFGGEAAFQVAVRGLAFANATAAKPILRETAERGLREFVDRANAINGSREYAFRIRSAVLFGSILSCADRLRDVDVAVDLQPSISDATKFRQLCDRRRHSAQEQGRALSTAMDWAIWPKKEVVLQLKARSRILSLHGFDQFMQMESPRYHILVGDADFIATQIPTGSAV